jgi:Tfp pilus assembly protein PilF
MDVFRSMNTPGSDQRACFIIGAGASKQSGIPTGGELALQWWQEMVNKEKTNEGKLVKWLIDPEPKATYERRKSLHKLWKNQKELKLADVAPYYSILYQNRFWLNKDEGFEALSKAMLSKQPSYGYSVLAKALCMSQHNVVITTNFDNLLEYSLHIFTNSHPLMCGHEALASFARHSNNRPLIAKIHRDLFLDPMNEDGELKRLKSAWVEPLKALLADRKVVVVGYGGNDGSLMGLLNEIPMQGRLYWCTYGKSQPQPEVLKMLSEKEGYLVETDGFDELMFLLRDALDIPRIDEEILKVANKRAESYRETEKDIIEKSEKSDKPEVRAATIDRLKEAEDDKDEWSYYLRARAEKNLEKRAELFKKGIQRFPESALLYGGLAHCLQFEMHSKDLAIEDYYKKALRFDPKNASNNGNYAVFLNKVLKDYDAAEIYYKKALEIDATNANFIGNLALFLYDVRKDYDTAETYYKKAIELDPYNAKNYANYASFLHAVRKNYDLAESYYKKALELNPNIAFLNGNFALMLHKIRKDNDGAEFHYKRALELDPNIVNNFANYALFLSEIRKDFDAAENHYKKAIDIDPTDIVVNASYALFLSEIRKDFPAAENYYKKALELGPANANNFGNYSKFLLAQNRKEDAIPYLEKAFELCANEDLLLELWFYRYAHYTEYYHEAKNKIEELLDKGVRSPGWDLAANVERAIKDGHPEPDELKRFAKMISETDGEKLN